MKMDKRLFIKITIFFVLLIILFLLLFLSWKNVKTNNKAVKYFNKGNFELAAQALDNELKNNPSSNYVIVNNSAGADYKLNKLDEAQVKYAVVINSTDSIKEDKFTALYDAGNVEFKKNNFEKSISFYKEALKINPNDADAKYNLEVALLKLNEKNDQQENKDNKQDNKKKDDEHKQQEQALKKQMEQNDKAQKENEKKQQEQNAKNNNNAESEKSNDKKQQELEKEKEELDKQRKEISDKIKDLMNTKKDKEQPRQKQETAQKEQKVQDTKQQDKSESKKQNQMKKDDDKDIQSAMFLNYYNEADKNSNKLRNNNKELLINQSQEDW
jgi:Ca-activated chloride channel family protein